MKTVGDRFNYLNLSGRIPHFLSIILCSSLIFHIEEEKDIDKEEGAEGSEFAEGDEDEGEKKEYVKKDFFARPYNSDGVTE